MARTTLSELNITPLLDLAFVLLIIFMITTPLMEQKIDIQLPDSRPNPSQRIDPKSVRQVAVDKQGRVFLDEKPVSVRQLEDTLRSFKASDPEAAVALRADAELRYQQLVDVLDAIKESGVKLGLATTPEKRR
jgi:biopolymer transport protein ExbD